MRIEDLNLTEPLPEPGPWRVLIIMGEPICKAEPTGALYRVTDGQLQSVDQRDLIPAAANLQDGVCY